MAYVGKFPDGHKFDGGLTDFTIGETGIIKGWNLAVGGSSKEGIDAMRVGGKRKVIIPPQLGYGDKPHSTIPANSTLIFDVELLDDGSAAVSWLERTDSTTAEVRLRRVPRDGQAGAPVVLARSSGARASGFPKITRRGPDLIAAWTIPGDTARIHLARYRLDALP